MNNSLEKQCISCGKCTANCEFLSKYQLDFSMEEKIKKWAYHCMLCGTCSRVCPIGIDGRARILNFRRESVEEKAGKLDGYKVLRGEKVKYKFKNYRRGQKKSVLFLGCNYPSLFPQTTKTLIELMEGHDVGVVFDCCGKPIGELGLEREANSIIERLQEQFVHNHIEELIVVCPNCYYYLKDKIKIPIRTIYEELAFINTEVSTIKEESQFFIPCPDKDEKKWLNDIQQCMEGEIRVVEDVQCCGLGGVASSKEPEYPSSMATKLDSHNKNTYVYCASCAGSFRRNGVKQIYHVLNEILESNEEPDIKRSMINRMKFKFK